MLRRLCRWRPVAWPGATWRRCCVGCVWFDHADSEEPSTCAILLFHFCQELSGQEMGVHCGCHARSIALQYTRAYSCSFAPLIGQHGFGMSKKNGKPGENM